MADDALENLTKRVLSFNTTFHWLPDCDRFWFKRQTKSGEDYVEVDANTGPGEWLDMQ